MGLSQLTGSSILHQLWDFDLVVVGKHDVLKENYNIPKKKCYYRVALRWHRIDRRGSNTNASLVCVLRHEVHEYFLIVEKFTIHACLSLDCLTCVWVFDPNIALVVLLHKHSLNNSIFLSLLLEIALKIIEVSRSGALHHKNTGDDEIRSRHCRNGRPHQVWVAGPCRSSCQLTSDVSLGAGWMRELITSRYLSLLLDIDELHSNFLVVGDSETVHCLDCCFCSFRITVLNESITLAGSCLRISVDIHIINFTKRFKKLFQVLLWNLSKLIGQTAYYYLCLSTDLFLLLLDRICRFDDSHLSE